MTTRSRELETQEQYRLLLHSLTHEDTESHVDRHVLVISKWLRDNDDGILLRDLEYVSQMLTVLRKFMASNPVAFRPLLVKFLKLSCKPILETKANERLRQKSMNDMRTFYTALVSFFQDDTDNQLKIEVAHTLRCIVSGGKDPAILRADRTPWKSDGTRFQITDIALIQSILRESAVIEKVVQEFTASVASFERGTLDFQQTALSFSQEFADLSLMENNNVGASTEEIKDFTEYGLPSPVSLEVGSTGFQHAAVGVGNSIEITAAANAATNPSGVLRSKKKEVGYVERVVQEILGLCEDLANDTKCCHLMGSLKICDALIHYLRYIAADNMKDKRVFVLVNLIWTILEAYLSQATMIWEKMKLTQIEEEPPLSVGGSGGGNEAVAEGEGDVGGLDMHPAPALELSEILDLEKAVSVFYEMLHRYAMEGFRDADKECRNECLAVLSLISDSPASHPAFYQTGLLNDLIYYACSAEAQEALQNDTDSDMGSPSKLSVWLSSHPQNQSKLRNFATPSELDLQFKRETWMLISDLLKGNDPLAMECVAQSPLLFALLAYVKYDTMASVLDGTGNLAGASSSGSVVGSRRMISEQPSHHSMGGGGQGQTHGSHLHHNSQGFGQGQQGPSDLNSRDSSTIAGGVNASSHDLHNPSRIGSVVRWGENNALGKDRPPSAGETSFATGPTVEPFIDHKKSIHLPLKDVTVAREVVQKTFFSSIPRVQMRELQVLAMLCLAENAAKFPEEFFAVDGPMQIYELTMHYCTSDYPEHKAVVGHALILLNRLLETSPRVCTLMEQQNAIQLLLFLFETCEDEGTRAQAIRAVALQCNTNRSSSELANNLPGSINDVSAGQPGMAPPNPLVCQTQLRQQGGIPLLVQAMRDHVSAKRPLVGLRAGVKILDKYALDPEDPILQPLNGDISVYIVAVLDCIAKAIVGNRQSEAIFAKNDGMDLLLEMMEVAPCVLRISVLRIVSDILENRDLVVHARLWRSPKTMRSAAQIATHCWLDEEVRLNASRVSGRGVICNMTNPMGNHAWPVDSQAQVLPGGESNSSASSVTTDVSAKSVAVTRLAAAIFQSRFNTNLAQGSVPLHMRTKVLEKDIRGVVASILQLLGVFEAKSVLDIDAHNSSILTDQGGPESDELDYVPSVNPSMLVHDGKTPQLAEESRIVFDERQERSTSDVSSPLRPSPSGGGIGTNPMNNSTHSPGPGALSPQQNSVGSLRSPATAIQGSGLLGYSQNLGGEGRSGEAGGLGEGSAALLAMVDQDQLTVHERQVVAMARRYAVLREGSWWSELQEYLRSNGVKPIEADVTMMQISLDRYFEATQTVQMEQMALLDLDDKGRKLNEKKFIDSILSMKNQEFKTELLKQQSKNHKTRVNPFTQKR